LKKDLKILRFSITHSFDMKKICLLSIAAILSLNALAQESGFGIGIIVGEPTGLSAKLWITENTALDAGVAWSFSGNGYLRLHTDMLWHKTLIEVEKGKLPLYYGVGAKLLLASDLGLGIRVPVGLAYQFESAPVDIFVELVPGLDLLPGTGFGIDAAIGARYYL
jgi:hypothetical protein